MKNNKTAIAYVRASTNEDKQSNSLNIQREVISNFAATNGYDVVREFSEYCSGTDDSRIVNMGDVEPNLMIIGVMLTIAAQESINTSVRLRATIKHLLAKDPSRTWGNQNLFAEHGAKAIEVRKANAMAYNTRIKGVVADLSLAGYTTVTAQFQRLNELGIKTRTNKPFTYHNLHRLMRS